MVIHIPQQLTPLNALNFAKWLKSMHRENKYIYDFSKMQHCPPFGMLIVANAIRAKQAAYPKSEHIPKSYDETQGCLFASDFGFFRMCGWDIGRLPSAESYGATYIPIKRISIKDLQNKYLDSTIILCEMVERYSQDLAVTLTRDANSPLTSAFRYCLREIIRNSYEHGNTEEVWVCGEYWKSKNLAQIAIIDRGIGIWNSLRQNSHYNPRNDREANKMALQPGITNTYGKKQDPFDKWENSGYGLFASSSICSREGSFWLCSGKDATLVNHDGQINYDIDFNGTAVCMDINTSKVQDVEKLLDEIIRTGEEKAAQYAGERVLTASKVSSITSLMEKLL